MTSPTTLDREELSSFFAALDDLLQAAAGPAAPASVTSDSAGRAELGRSVWGKSWSFHAALTHYHEVNSLCRVDALRASALSDRFGQYCNYHPVYNAVAAHSVRLHHRNALSARRSQLLIEYYDAVEASRLDHQQRRRQLWRSSIGALVSVALYLTLMSGGDALLTSTVVGGLALATWAVILMVTPTSMLGVAVGARSWRRGSLMSTDLWRDVLWDEDQSGATVEPTGIVVGER